MNRVGESLRKSNNIYRFARKLLKKNKIILMLMIFLLTLHYESIYYT